MMTLTSLLEIERRFLTDEDERCLLLAERLWAAYGNPQEARELCRTLESILCACERRGLRYPPILLRRKRELQRGDWKPRPQTADSPAAALRLDNEPPSAQPAVAPVHPPTHKFDRSQLGCAKCAHKGVVLDADGNRYHICECVRRACNLQAIGEDHAEATLRSAGDLQT